MFRLWGIVHKVAMLGMIGGIGWLAWQHVGPEEPRIDSARTKALESVIADIARDLQGSRKGLRQVAMLQFQGDGSGIITDSLRSKLEYVGVFDLESRGVTTKLRRKLGLREPAYGTADEAIREGNSLGAKGVLAGNVRRFESVPGGAAYDVEVTLCDVTSRETVFNKTYKRDDSAKPSVSSAAGMKDSAAPKADDATPSWFTRGLAWLLLVLLLPVFTIAFMRGMMRQKSNKTNVVVLGLYTVADGVMGFLFLGAAISSWFCAVIFAIAIGFALAYNVRMMSYALRLES
ncbi:MAG: hypothetical protein NTV86_00140 [Planctomycetota bacterium]|nr:hypothetical protein [Planctomycetota bacterium]